MTIRDKIRASRSQAHRKQISLPKVEVRDDDTPKGFTCECGKKHNFSAYVFAHWNERLVHTCDQCNRLHTICAGEATIRKREKMR